MKQLEINRYVLVDDNKMGIGALHKNAICYLAYVTALRNLQLNTKCTKEVIKKLSIKKVEMKIVDESIVLNIKLPVKADDNITKVISDIQKNIKENFERLLDISVSEINIMIDDIYI